MKHYYEFGSYRLALSDHRLYRNGEVVLLPPKEFDLLLLLVQNSGQVMGREHLLKALWPNTIVEEANLNVHISALRKALAESNGQASYIETLPRLGYRFVVPVTQVEEPEVPPAAVVSAASSLDKISNTEQVRQLDDLKGVGSVAVTSDKPERQRWFARHRTAAVVLPLWLLALGLLGTLAFLLFFKSRRPVVGEQVSTGPMNVVPLTTYPGRETQPAFSADGNYLAFVWGGEKGGNNDVYVRLVDGGNWVRLTTQPGDDVNPAWSPDGRTVAFYRSAPDGDGVFLVPSLGGAERRLTSTWANRFSFGTHTWLHWSPDGKWIVVSDKGSTEEPFSLFLLSPTTGERRRITTPPNSVIGDCSPAFSPDGKQLAFVRVVSAVVGEVYLVATEGGEAKRLTFDGTGVSSVAWTPNGRELVFSSRHSGGSRLLRVPVTGGTPQWLAASSNNAQYPAFARQGNRLAWMQNTDNTDLFRVELKSGAEGNASAARFIASTAGEVSPRYSPDGKKIVFESNRSGSNEIWVCDSDGANPTRLTSFRGPLAGSPTWSPDGRQIVFDCRPDGNADIFTISVDGGQPRRLTTDPAEDIVPNWSHDGRWIYFTSNRSGRLQIWKMSVDGSQATQLTQQGGFEPIESADGQWLYFAQDRGSSSLLRMPVAGGEVSPLFDFHQKSYTRAWVVAAEGIYFAAEEASARTSIRFFSFATGAVKTVTVVDGNFPVSVSGLTLSPDESRLLFPIITQRGSDLMLLENFN